MAKACRFLPSMACARLAAACALALLFTTPASARSAAPQGLKAFSLRVTEPGGRTFSRTPSFAWQPAAGAKKYEFELATSASFRESGVLWSDDTLKSPAASVPIALPWLASRTGYSLYARVRAYTRKGITAWSAPYGFNMRWAAVPQPLASYPGLLRWTTVPGATGYAVWLTDIGKIFTVRTNVADEREYFSFHQDAFWTSTVHWRIRPLRWLYGTPKNGLPAVSYGPWSPVYTSYNPPFAAGPLAGVATISDTTSTALAPQSHGLMPGFAFTGDQSMWGVSEELYRVYVFTDVDCLNIVYRGAIVGSPAYAPRPTGPLALPTTSAEVTDARTKYLGDGAEPPTFTFEGIRVTTTEAGEGSAVAGGGSSPTGGTSGSGTSIPIEQLVNGAKVDLWDSDWPTGRYYWTIMPVRAVTSQPTTTTLTSAAFPGSATLNVGNATAFAAGDTLQIGPVATAETVVVMSVTGNRVTLASAVTKFHAAGEPVVRPGGALEYRDMELTQDSCDTGRVLAFGRSSEPVVTGNGAPFASGLSPTGELFSASRSRPSFYGAPLVAWQPTLGADKYEVQWSRTGYPWKTVGKLQTNSTSTTLPLAPGSWYYRVRGLNFSVPGGKPEMSWSDPVALRLTKPRFRVVR